MTIDLRATGKSMSIAALAAGLAGVAGAQATFTVLPFLPNTTTNQGVSISDDGNFVTGNCWGEPDQANFQAYRWSSGSGIVGIPSLPGGDQVSEAHAISANGTTVVGRCYAGNGREAFLWTSGGGTVGLGDLAGGSFSSKANDVSADGSVVVGIGAGTSNVRAFRWTASGGMVDLGNPTGGTGSNEASGVNSNGSIVVGIASTSLGYKAFRWKEGEGMLSLGDLPGGSEYAWAFATSEDGAVVVGQSNNASGTSAFRWTSAGIQDLGDFAGGTYGSSAEDVSADGAWIVGYGNTANGREAFIWNQSLGMKNLRQFLIDNGATGLTGWTLRQARGISANGKKIVGIAENSSGQTATFVADIGSLSFNGSQYVSQTPPPTTMVAGTKANVAITMRNIGTTTWTPGGKYYIGSRNPVDNVHWGARRLAMANGSSAAPGTNYTYNAAVTAPWEPGTYNFQWKMLTPSGWFGDLTANRTVTVTRAANAGVFVSQTGIPTTIAPGGTFTASITMKNTGTASWTTATGFKLGSWSPTNNTVWGTNRWDMPAGSNIATDGQVTFTRTFTAPTTPGTYVFQWRMIKSGVAFFGTTSTAVKITVQ